MSGIVLALLAQAAGAQSPQVVVLPFTGASYDAMVGGQLNVAARQQVAQQFYAGHDDLYDFLVVFPNFAADFGKEVGGLNTAVRNAVQGIGLPQYDNGLSFGSSSRLGSYLDLGSLRTGTPQPIAGELVVLAHEVGHQWLVHPTFIRSPGTAPSSDLLGQAQAHWSFFLDDQASVMYGSSWRNNGDGTFTAVESERRYSPLDLYLMGFFDPSEVPAFQLLHPQASVPFAATSTPPPDGTVIAATPEPVTVQQIITSLGPRSPAVAVAPHSFRAAFILLAGPGQPATAAQIAFVDAIRTAFENDFFFLTDGRGIVDTQLAESTPGSVSSNPSVASGLSYLLGQQAPSGAWQDSAATALRDTQEALDTLNLFANDARVAPAQAQAATFLRADVTPGMDALARRTLAVLAAHASPTALDTLLPLQQLSPTLNLDAANTYSPFTGYGASVIDSALAARALAAGAQPGDVSLETDAANQLLPQQNATDLGWPFLIGGPSRIEPTAQAMDLLFRLRGTTNGASYALAAGSGAVFLEGRRQSDGQYADDQEHAASTSRALLALAQWQRLSPADAAAAAQVLLHQQAADGSWEESSYQTALTVRALRTALTPNLVLVASGSSVSSSIATDGETILLTAEVQNNGYVAAQNIPVQAFDSNGVPFGPPQNVSELQPGDTASVLLPLDTTGHAGSTRVFAVVDPNGTIDELTRADNRAAFALQVQAPPNAVDLFAAQGSVAVSPGAVSAFPTTLTVTARVGNVGLAGASQVQVSLVVLGQTLATTVMDFPARSLQTVTLVGTLNSASSSIPVTVVVDPNNQVQEARKDNNSATTVIPLVPTVNLSITQFVLTPPETPQGGDVDVLLSVTNSGTIDATQGTRALAVNDSTGATVLTFPVLSTTFPSAQTITLHATYRADVAGNLTVTAQVSNAGQPAPNGTASAALKVDADPRANLFIAPGGVSLSPNPPLQASSATASALVQNGGADAGAFRVDFWLGNPDAGGARFAQQVVPGLAGGQSVSVAGTFVPGGDASFVFVQANPDRAVPEFDYADDSAVAPFTPVTLPDLVLTSADILPASRFPRPGDVVPVTLSVLNAGGQSAQSVTAELFLGSPEDGGVSIASQVVASMPGNARTDVVFSWNTTGLSGTVPLVGVVNRNRAVQESHYDNDEATLPVTFQTGPLALSNPYFSPNGDGVKDTTRLYFQLSQPGPVQVLIKDRFSHGVRTLQLASSGTNGFVDWDGTTDTGRVGRDGPYQLEVSSGGSDVGSIQAVLDTNLLPLEDAWQRSDLQTIQPLNRLGTAVASFGSFAAMPDETGLILAGSILHPDKTHECGLYFEELPLQLPPVGLPGAVVQNCGTQTFDDVAVSPDGTLVLFEELNSAVSSSWHLNLYNRVTQATADLGAASHCFQRSSPGFSPDGQRVAMIECPPTGDLIEEVAVPSGARAPLFVSAPQSILEVHYLPDGSGLTYQDFSQDVFVIPAGGSPVLELQIGGDPSYGGVYTASADSQSLYFLGVSGLLTSNDATFCKKVVCPFDPQCESGPPSSCTYATTGGVFQLNLQSSQVTPLLVRTGPFDGQDPIAGALAASSSGTALGAVELGIFSLRSQTGAADPLLMSAPPGNPSVTLGTLPSISSSTLSWSPRGTFLVEGQSQTAAASYANLPVSISAFRRPGSQALSVFGLADDANFASVSVSERVFGSTGPPLVLARSNAPVLNAELTQWIPLAPGLYEVTATATDLAGNSRKRVTEVAWPAPGPAISNVRMDPRYISPNGDGIQDTTLVQYTVNQPISADFEIAGADGGAIVRDFPVTQLTQGDFSFAWDGRTSAGVVAPDGPYVLSVETVQLPVVVDTLPPTCTLNLASPSTVVPLTSGLATDQGITPSGAVPVAALSVHGDFSVNDLNFNGWTLEQSGPGQPTQFVALKSGSSTSDKVDLLARQIRGTTLRIRATDLAGNSTVHGPVAPAEGVGIVAAGPASTLDQNPGLLTLPDGTQLPRVDLLIERDLASPLGAFSPTRWAFYVDDTLSHPVMRYQLAYRLQGSGAFVDDTADLAQVGIRTLEWDSRALSGVAQIQISALDSAGQTFSTVADFSGGGVGVLLQAFCPGPDPSQAELQWSAGGPILTLNPPGATLSFVPNGSAAPEMQVPGGFTVPESVGVDLSALSACRYTVDFSASVGDGGSVTGAAPIDICALVLASQSVNSAGASITLGSSLREPVSSIDVLVSGVPVGTLAPFAGISPPLSFSAAGLACGQPLSVEAVVHDVDGSQRLTAVGPPPCLQPPPKLVLPCDQVTVTASLATLATQCVPQSAVYNAQVAASAPAGVTLTSLSLALVAQGGAQSPVPLAGFVAGAATGGGTARIDTTPLLDGTYSLVATLVDSAGTVATGSTPLVVDHTPPVVQLLSPTEGAVVCPRGGVVAFSGSVSDDHLTSYGVVLTGPESASSFTPASGGPVSFSGTLATIPTGTGSAKLPSGTYHALAEASDVSGSSSCSTPPVDFFLQNGITLSSLAAAPPLFSPDGDGVLDATTVSLTTDSPGSLSLSAVQQSSGTRFPILQASVPSGPFSFPWNGSSSGGTLPDGVYVLVASAVDSCGNTSAPAQTEVAIDTTPPVARIDVPIAGATVRGTLAVEGQATDLRFLSYELDLGQGAAPTLFQVVASSTSAVTGVLGTVDTQGLSPGPYTLRLTARDSVGHVSTAAVTFNVAPPSLIGSLSAAPPVISPSGNGSVNAATVSYSLTAPAVASLDVIDSTDAGVATLFPATSLSGGPGQTTANAQTLGPLVDGDYRVRLSAQASSTTDEALAPLSIDNTPPVLSVTQPQAGGYVPGSSAVVGSILDAHLSAWTLTDAPPDGGTVAIANGSTPVQGAFAALAGIADGRHTVTLSATDVAGNHSSLSIPFTSDSTPPVLSFAAPDGGTYLSGDGGAVLVQVLVTEVNFAGLGLSAGQDAGSLHLLATFVALADGGVTFPWNVGAEPDGPTTLVAVATDLAGNAADASVQVVVDNTPPAAFIASPRSTFLPPGNAFTGVASDVNLDHFTLDISDGPPSTAFRFVTVGTGTTPVDGGVLAALAAPPPDGMYTARLTVVDRAGNQSVDLAGFQVRNVPPAAPTGLTAQVQGVRDVALAWTASPSPGVVGYQVFRQSGAGPFVQLTSTPVAGVAYVDPAVPDGTYGYQVVAVNDAALLSPPSNTAQVQVHANAPTLALTNPAAGSEIAAVVSVAGTATSPYGLQLYRLSIGAGVSPAAFTLLFSGALPVVNGPLGTFDASALPQGSTQTLRLEAVDLFGNSARLDEVVTVQNLPPSAPVLVSATAQVQNVRLTWLQNPETDLAGYLLYRNGALVNAPAGVSVSNLTPYVLPPSQLSYQDVNAPDGTLTYQLKAIDLGGLLSPFSNALTVTLENRAPSVSVTTPPTLSRLSGPTLFAADGPDLDIAQVQFQVRAGSQPSFSPVGAPLTASPYALVIDPSQFTSDVLEVRAVATDTTGLTDPAPPSVFVFFDPALATPAVQTRVDGGAVTASWTDPDLPPHLAGYQALWDGNSLFPFVAAAGAATASSTSSGTPQTPFTHPLTGGWSSAGGAPQFWQVVFVQPVPVVEVDFYQFRAASTATLSVRLDGAWVPVARGQTLSTGSPYALRLSPPYFAEGIRVDFTATPSGFAELDGVFVDQLSPVLASGTTKTNLPGLGNHSYSVKAMSRFGLFSDAGTAGALVYRPVLTGPAAVATPVAHLTGSNAAPDASVEIDALSVAVTTVGADAGGAFAADVPVDAGPNSFVAIATDPAGNRSLPSNPFGVIYDAAPDASVSIALAGISQSDVSLSIAVQGDTSRLALLDLRRSPVGGTEVSLGQVAPTTTAFTDPKVPNGNYVYRALPLNVDGLAGPPSNSVPVTVNVTTVAPSQLTVTAPPSGGELSLAWSYTGPSGSTFSVERASTLTGPFGALPGATALTSAAYNDFDVVDGVPQFYRVRAVDTAGNVSDPSNVASGTPRDTDGPAAPAIDAPTTAGKPVTIATATVTVAGTAEPTSTVTLLQGGTAVATVPTSLALAPVPLTTTHPIDGTLAVSPDGSVLAYSYVAVASPRTHGVALEIPAAGKVLTFTAPNVDFHGRIQLSPDLSLVAAEGLLFGLPHIYVGTVATGAFIEVPGSVLGQEAAPTWSPDSTRLAYAATRRSNSGLAILSVSKNVESFFAATALANPLWLPNGQDVVAMVGPGLSRLNAPAYTAATLTAFPSADAMIAVGPANQVAVALGNGPSQILLVDATTGATQTIVQDQNFDSFPAFTATGRLLYFSNETLVSVQLSTNQSQELNGAFAGLVLPLASGEFAVTPGSVDPTSGVFFSNPGGLFNPVGRFVFAGVPLSAGLNLFTASAVDSEGNTSPLAAPIDVTLDASDLPDLAINALVAPPIPVATQPASAYITVSNVGDGGAPAAQVSVTVLSPDGGSRQSPLFTFPGSLGPGQTAVGPIAIDLSGLSGPQQLIAVVDPSDLIPDPNRSNNRTVVPFTVASSNQLGISVAAAPPSVPVNGSSTATVTVLNPGPAVDMALHLALVAPDGTEVLTAGPDTLFQPLPALSTTNTAGTFNVRTTLAGAYSVVASAIGDGGLIAQAQTPLQILSDTAASLSLVSARASYAPTDTIELDSTIRNQSRNALLQGAELAIQITDNNGVPKFQSQSALPLLPIGGTTQQPTFVAPLGLPPGTYPALGALTWDGGVLATASAVVQIQGQATLVGQLSIAGASTSPALVPSGQPAVFDFQAQNTGNAVASGVVLHVGVVDGSGHLVAPIQDFPAGTLNPGASFSGVASFPTAALLLGAYVGLLTADGAGATSLLASSAFDVIDSQPPKLNVLAPLAGAYLKGTLPADLLATDNASGTQTVRVSIDGAAAIPLQLVNGTILSGEWAASAPLAPDGTHQLVFSAADFAGNDGLTAPGPTNPVTLMVTSDTVAPQVFINGLPDSGITATPVTAVIRAVDVNLASTSATLNGSPYVSGTPIAVDGDFTLIAVAFDKSGNEGTANARFTLDQTPPQISISGVSDGEVTSASVTPVVTVTDAHLASSSILLDGAPFSSGTAVSAEGNHVLSVSATDTAGNSSQASVHFAIDRTAPVISITGVTDGEMTRQTVVPGFTATDLHLLTVAGTLNGAPFASGTAVSAEGTYTLVVVATDAAENSSTAKATFTIDRTPPVVTLAGFTNGSIVNVNVTPTFTATDAHLASVTATLNGASFASGTTVTADGAYTLSVTATDLAGNSTTQSGTFTIDKTPPVVTLAGFVTGEYSNQSVTPTYSASDAHLASVTATLNGVAFASGTVVTAEGAYTLAVTATDLAGNSTTRSGTFTIDKTPPVITITGVADGQQGESFTISFSATDANLASVSATLDGAPFVSGATVTSAATHTLVVTALDKAGNSATQTVHFTVVQMAPPFPSAVCATGNVLIENLAAVNGFDGGLGSVAADGTLTMNTQGLVTGGAACGGNASLNNQARVTGELDYGGTLSLMNGAKAGTTRHISPAPSPCVCGFDVASALAQARLNNNDAELHGKSYFVDGGLVLNNGTHVALDGGRYYLTSISVNNNSSLSVVSGHAATLFVAGNVAVNNQSTLGATPPTATAFIVISGAQRDAGQTVVLDNQAAAALQVYAPNADLTLNNGAHLYGAFVGHNVTFDNHEQLTQAPAGATGPPPLTCP